MRTAATAGPLAVFVSSRRFVALGVAGLAAVAAPLAAATLPPGFQETVVFTGLTNPTAMKFAADGRVFVAEKSGLVKVFDDLLDATPTTFADLRGKVHNFWDRGLLGLELHPDFPATPYVYVLYTLDGPIGWSGPGARWNDACPSPPGPTSDGCVVGARLSRLTAAGDVTTGAEQVFLEDWCQQYPSHSIGSLAFGGDGALYVSGGDGASFNFADWGQDGNPLNPCGDPPTGVGGTQAPPTAEGGALRAQDLETAGDPVSFDGAVLRLDPITGEALPDNPLYGGATAGDDRIVAYGLRNPFRLTVRPGTSEVWVGDVGWNVWEEIDRLPDPTAEVRNFGWPCYEGPDRQPGYDGANLAICESLYGRPAAVAPPFFAYRHSDKVVAGETCGTGSSAIAGLAFYEGGNYPNEYAGALFFADYNRKCLWAMRAGTDGLPDPALRLTFVAGAAGPVQIATGPGGDLFYADFDSGTIRRLQYRGPTAVARGTPVSGPSPLTVSFDGAASSDPDGDALLFAWDLDGDGALDDSISSGPQFTYGSSGTYTVRLRVTDGAGLSDTASLTISVGNGPPSTTIASPVPSLRWSVGQVVSFSGSATDPDEGSLPASALTWTLVLQHCPDDCHEHVVQQFPGEASGSFVAPDHEYPSQLELRLRATDATGATDTRSVTLLPRTVVLTFETSPPAFALAVGADAAPAPFTREVIMGSSNSLSAPAPQERGGVDYGFDAWSDGGAQSHNVVAPAAATTYRAVFHPTPPPTFAVSDVTAFEGNAGTTTASFTVTLSAPSGKEVSVDYATADGTAAAGSDFLPLSGTLVFLPGQVQRTVVVTVMGDALDEADEAFTLVLSNPASASLEDAEGLGAILDDDLPPALRIADASVVEGRAGLSPMPFAVTLEAPSGREVKVSFATSPGRARPGSDYVPATGVLTLPPGTIAGTITVQVVGDRLHEKTETFTMILSGAFGATLADGRGIGRIVDDDPGLIRPPR